MAEETGRCRCVMERQLTPAERIERFRRCCIEQRPIHTPDAWCVLDQLDQLKRRQLLTQKPRRLKRVRDAALVELADMICPGLTPSQTGRVMLHIIDRELQSLPAAALDCLERVRMTGGVPTTPRQIANVAKVIRDINEPEI